MVGCVQAWAFVLLSFLLLGCASQQTPPPSPTVMQTPTASASIIPSPPPSVSATPASLNVKTREEAIYYSHKSVKVVLWLNHYTGAPRENPVVAYEAPYWVVKYVDNTCVDTTPDRVVCTMTAKIDEKTGAVVETVQT